MRLRGPFLPLLASAACILGIWRETDDLLYALEGAPEALGGLSRPLDSSRLRPNQHASLAGLAEAPGWTATLGGETRELWLLQGAPVLVLRAPNAPGTGGKVEGLVPLEVTGRVYRGDRGGGWTRAAEAVASARGGAPSGIFLVVEGESPAMPWGALGVTALLATVLVLNALWFRGWVRGLRERKRVADDEPGDGRAPPEPDDEQA